MATRPPPSTTATPLTAKTPTIKTKKDDQRSKPEKLASIKPTTAQPTAPAPSSASKSALKSASATLPKTQSTDTDSAPGTTSTAVANKARRRPRKLVQRRSGEGVVGGGVQGGGGGEDEERVSELEALKARVRGLEGRVEELYTSSTTKNTATAVTQASRSPRRRGKGRKTSSTADVATLKSLASAAREGNGVDAGVRDEKKADEEEVPEEEAEEELLRLEGQLQLARQDLESYNPASQPQPQSQAQRTTTRPSPKPAPDTDIEEIPRITSPPPRTRKPTTTTLTGSYRIPLPASLSPSDLASIKAGVGAAQNVARGFLESRRSTSSTCTSTAPGAGAGADQEIKGEAGEKQTWAHWVGGYSMAVTRAVRSVEYEAVLERERERGR